MSALIGIPTTRISNLFVYQQMARQVQYDQQELFRLERRLSSGQAFAFPSESPSAAMRVISAQRLLEQKQQIEKNLETGRSYLAATDSAMSQIADVLADVRAAAIGAMNTTIGQEQRDVAVTEIKAAIEYLVDVGNKKFRGRYLFGGKVDAGEPFSQLGDSLIQYHGGQQRLTSLSDVGTPFDINVTGSEVFGAVSEPVLGTADFDPVVAFHTRLADLRGGLGIERGQIAVTVDGATSVIDLGSAETVGDVALMLRNNPPAGTALDVEITPTGLTIALDAAPGAKIKIEEVGDGQTAAQLGILTESPVSGPIVGDDLDPILRPTTSLKDLFGTRSSEVVRFDGGDNDLIFEAGEVGTATNGIRIVFEDDGSVFHAGSDEQATYDAPSQTLRVTFKEGATRAVDVVRAVHAAYEAGTVPLDARLDPLDDVQGGSGYVEASPPGGYSGLSAGGSGTTLDLASGLHVANGGQTYTIDFAGAETVEDLIGTINTAGAGLLAEINASATGIDLRTRISGADFAIGENGGTTATQLGLRTFTQDLRLEDLNFGRGVHDFDGTDFTITLADAAVPPIEIDLAGIETVGELIDLVNLQSPGNLEARLATVGNGIELQDYTAGAGTLTVAKADLSRAAVDLGLVADGQSQHIAGTSPPGQPDVLRGADVYPQEAKGIFTALSRLSNALGEGSLVEAQRALDVLDQSASSMSFSRAELGIRQQNLDVIGTRLEDEKVNIQEAISLDFDADLVQTVSDYEARRVALEAALMTSSKMLQLSLLNYL